MESLESTTPNSPEAWIRRPEAWTDHRPWLERFREMVAALEAHPLITVTTLMIAPPATEEEIAAARAYHPIPAALEALYRQSNGVTLRWNAKECGDRVMGSIRILPVEETFTSQEYSIWEDVEEDSETLSLHPVDYFEPEAYVAIHLKEGVDRGMWYGTIEDCDDLKLSLEALSLIHI
jgi:hypothetical protein